MAEVRQEGAEKDDKVLDAPQKPIADPKLTKFAGYHGTFEANMAKFGKGALTNINGVSANGQRQIPGYGGFKEQFDIYRSPFQQSMMSLGRVNDLNQSGAPRTPKDISPDTMKFFKPIDNVSNKTDDKLKSQSANQMIEQQDELHSNFDSYMAAKHALTGTMAEWRSVKALLNQRSLAAKKADDEEAKSKIDEAADTLVEITKFSAEALTVATSLEGEIMEGVSEEYTATAEEGVQTAEVTRKYKTEKMMEVAKTAGGKIGLKELFIIGMGDYTKYRQLQASIAKLEGQIKNEKWNQEENHIDAAKKNMDAVQIEVTGRKRAFEGKRQDSRNAAQAFGQAMNGRDKTIAVTMMAEAYQELDLFGSSALNESGALMKADRPVWNYLQDKVERFKVERNVDFDEWADDYRAIGAAHIDAVNSKAFLETEQPLWHSAATAWKHFLSDVMNKQFDPRDSDAAKQKS